MQGRLFSTTDNLGLSMTNAHLRHMKKTPLILAHRGLVTEYQENTLAAIEGAIDHKCCDGTEFDVFLTKDNRVVLFHDENMKRLTGIDRSIYDMTWEDLKTIQILPALEVDGGMREYAGPASIPLLEDVLETIKGKAFFLDIELKAYSPSWAKRTIGRAVADIVKRMDVLEQVVCTSFNFFMLHDLEKRHRATPTGYAYDDNMHPSAKFLNWLMETNLIGQLIHSNAVCAEYTLIDADTIAKFHRRNMQVGCFTLYPLTPGEMPADQKALYRQEVNRLAALGVDWIETDRPELVWQDLHG
jgi:glycerophosphoryl diester phosphodiesterase